MRRVSGMIGGAFFGVLVATMIKGLLIGLSQTHVGFGWLPVLLGIVSGPALLFPDLLLVRAGLIHQTVVLSWAIVGLLAGAALGYASARPDSGGEGKP